jgi:hypothetical protein
MTTVPVRITRKETHVQELETRKRRPLRASAKWIAIVLLGAAILMPSVGGAAAFLTKQKAKKLFLGNTVEITQTVSVPDQQTRTITVLCPPGFQATGGGADSPALVATPPATELMILLDTIPVNAGGRSVGWQVEVLAASNSGDPVDVTASAVCSK